eukprot:CAMPEP_0198237552 /NCGR_PEP_ID=MMETSP1446-20131203/3351_1 /TAXON_ID=1461542 ORGANISM="Unidentified sp, Strain CCMP2111" /NCGR_SAMPLE_ID=MMETSP1446 /ASSEMBLY_ACC=CAM_ASM_001112 /LENGTH=299 /DNA_ID=CAMNT_0043919721 /DNA_START=945 /DNA_END=1845 /DNA_ORIENTATION=-
MDSKVEVRGKTPCIFHQKGICTKGDTCPFSHELAANSNSLPTSAVKSYQTPGFNGAALARPGVSFDPFSTKQPGDTVFGPVKQKAFNVTKTSRGEEQQATASQPCAASTEGKKRPERMFGKAAAKRARDSGILRSGESGNQNSDGGSRKDRGAGGQAKEGEGSGRSSKKRITWVPKTKNAAKASSVSPPPESKSKTKAIMVAKDPVAKVKAKPKLTFQPPKSLTEIRKEKAAREAFLSISDEGNRVVTPTKKQKTTPKKSRPEAAETTAAGAPASEQQVVVVSAPVEEDFDKALDEFDF